MVSIGLATAKQRINAEPISLTIMKPSGGISNLGEVPVVTVADMTPSKLFAMREKATDLNFSSDQILLS